MRCGTQYWYSVLHVREKLRTLMKTEGRSLINPSILSTISAGRQERVAMNQEEVITLKRSAQLCIISRL